MHCHRNASEMPRPAQFAPFSCLQSKWEKVPEGGMRALCYHDVLGLWVSAVTPNAYLWHPAVSFTSPFPPPISPAIAAPNQ
jgi:hypothetical protein